MSDGERDEDLTKSSLRAQPSAARAVILSRRASFVAAAIAAASIVTGCDEKDDDDDDLPTRRKLRVPSASPQRCLSVHRPDVCLSPQVCLEAPLVPPPDAGHPGPCLSPQVCLKYDTPPPPPKPKPRVCLSKPRPKKP